MSTPIKTSGGQDVTLKQLHSWQVLVDGKAIGSIRLREDTLWEYRRFGPEWDTDAMGFKSGIKDREQAIELIVKDWEENVKPFKACECCDGDGRHFDDDPYDTFGVACRQCDGQGKIEIEEAIL